jgi:hypothetical protein
VSDARTLGLPQRIPFAGRDWRVGERTFEVQANYVVWLEGQAYAAVERHRPRMPAQWYVQQSAGTRQDVASLVYSWGSDRCMDSLFTPDGCKQMAFQLLLSAEEPGFPVHEGLVEKMWADPPTRERLKQIVWAEWLLPDPNGQGAEGAPGKNPSTSTPSAPSSSSAATAGTKSAS